MSDIKITREHSLPEAEIKQKVDELAQKLVKKHGGSYRDEGQAVSYKTTGVDAKVTHDASTLEISVKLGFLMKGFSGMLKKEIESYLDSHV